MQYIFLIWLRLDDTLTTILNTLFHLLFCLSVQLATYLLVLISSIHNETNCPIPIYISLALITKIDYFWSEWLLYTGVSEADSLYLMSLLEINSLYSIPEDFSLSGQKKMIILLNQFSMIKNASLIIAVTWDLRRSMKTRLKSVEKEAKREAYWSLFSIELNWIRS